MSTKCLSCFVCKCDNGETAVSVKLNFEYIKDKILQFNAKSIYKQAAIVILRSIFNDFEKSQEIYKHTNDLTDAQNTFKCSVCGHSEFELR